MSQIQSLRSIKQIVIVFIQEVCIEGLFVYQQKYCATWLQKEPVDMVAIVAIVYSKW